METNFIARLKALRYGIDDTFIVFREQSHSNLFLDFLNSKHPNINFTMETEVDNKISFLDCVVTREGGKFLTGVFRKKTFSGLGTSFFSFTPYKFKISAFNTLLTRAFNLSSSHTFLCKELSFLQNFFHANGFPLKMIILKIRQFISSRDVHKDPNFDVPKKKLFISLPYFGSQSDDLGRDLRLLFDKFFFHVDFKIIFTNKFTIGSFFKLKDPLPLNMRSKIIYKYCCALSCGSQYVGCTTRNFKTRMFEHRGISPRTDRRLAKPSQSSIRAHCEQFDKCVDLDNFQIIGSANSFLDLRILESLLIRKLRPNLNNMDSSFPLKIV